MRVALAQAIRVGKLQGPVEILRPAGRLLLGKHPVEHRRLGDLFADGDGRVEGGRGALGQVGDVLTAKFPPLHGLHGEDILAAQQHLAAAELQARLGIGERRQCDGGLAGTGLADERAHLTRLDVEGNALDDGDRVTFLITGLDLQVFYFE